MSFKMSPELLHKLAELIEDDSVLSLDEVCGDLARLARIRKWGFVPTPAQARKAFEQLEAAAQVVISRNGYIRPADRMRRVVFAKGTRIGPAKAFKFYNRRAGPWRGRRTVGPDGMRTEIAEVQS